MSDELIHAFERLRDSSTYKVVVIDGAGGTFCAGDDITEMNRWGSANDIMRRVRGYQHMADTLEALDKITIAAVNGYAVGGGLEITMACDFVIAATSARWGMPGRSDKSVTRHATVRSSRWRFLATEPGRIEKCTWPSSSTAIARTTAWP